jgi:hypothetical protein
MQVVTLSLFKNKVTPQPLEVVEDSSEVAVKLQQEVDCLEVLETIKPKEIKARHLFSEELPNKPKEQQEVSSDKGQQEGSNSSQLMEDCLAIINNKQVSKNLVRLKNL